MVAENEGTLRWAFQTAKGTPAAASVFGSFLAGGTMVGVVGEDAELEETTSAQVRSDRYVVERHAEGVPEFYCRPGVLASLLYGILGAVATTGETDPYTHAATLALTRPWMTFWKYQAGMLKERSSDCKIDQLVITGETGRPLRATATVRGLAVHHQTAEENTATIETLFPHVFYHGDGALKLEGGAVASFSQFQMTITRAGELVGGASLGPIDNTEGLCTVQTQVTRLFTSPALRNRKWFGGAEPSNNAAVAASILELGTPPSLDFKFTAQAASPGPERSIQLVIPRLTVAPWEIPIGTGAAPVREALVLDMLAPSSGSPITGTVKNGMADLTP